MWLCSLGFFYIKPETGEHILFWPCFASILLIMWDTEKEYIRIPVSHDIV